MPQFHIQSSYADDDGFFWLNGQQTDDGSIEPDQRIIVKDQTGRERIGRIDQVEENGSSGLSLRIDKTDTGEFDKINLDGKKAEVKIPVRGADFHLLGKYGPYVKWWSGMATFLIIGGIIWVLWYFELLE